MKTFKYQPIITENYLVIEEAIKEAILDKLFIFIFGESGYGKSFSFADQTKRSKGSIVHQEISINTRPVDLYNNTIQTFPNYQNYKVGTPKYGAEKASDLFKSNLYKQLLIIDEANNFKPGMLGHIRDFRDKTEFSNGLIISGPPEFERDLQEWRDRRVKGINELYTRVDEWITLNDPSYKEFDQICNVNGIEDDSIKNEILTDCTDYRTLSKRIKKHYRKLGYKIVGEDINAKAA